MYEERVLAYIDILGFKDTVKNTIDEKTGIEIPYNTERINSLLDEEHLCLNVKEYFLGEAKIVGKVISQFSDTIVVSYLKESAIHHILLDVYLLCTMALEKGFLFRGAIVCGKVFHTKRKIFGPALIKAYKMENSMAIFPRIVIDEDILDIAKGSYSKYSNPDAEYNNMMKFVFKDFDGIYFINYIDKLYTGVDCGSKGEQEHLRWLCENIKELEIKIDMDYSIKYLWLKEKYNLALSTRISTDEYVCHSGSLDRFIENNE
jgi:hypothetical protein